MCFKIDLNNFSLKSNDGKGNGMQAKSESHFVTIESSYLSTDRLYGKNC